MLFTLCLYHHLWDLGCYTRPFLDLKKTCPYYITYGYLTGTPPPLWITKQSILTPCDILSCFCLSLPEPFCGWLPNPFVCVLSFLALNTGTILDGWEPGLDMVCVTVLLGFLAENLGMILSSQLMVLLYLTLSESSGTWLSRASVSLLPKELKPSFLGFFCVPNLTPEQRTVWLRFSGIFVNSSWILPSRSVFCTPVWILPSRLVFCTPVLSPCMTFSACELLLKWDLFDDIVECTDDIDENWDERSPLNDFWDKTEKFL